MNKIKQKILNYIAQPIIVEYQPDIIEYNDYLLNKNKKFKMIKKAILVGCDETFISQNICDVLPRLLYLRITISSISSLPSSLSLLHLKTLSLDACNVVLIENLPFLEYIECYRCNMLRKIKDVPSISQIVVLGCPLLVFDDVEKMPLLKTLIIDNKNYFE